MTKKPPIDAAKVTVRTLRAMKRAGEKIVALTAYDAPMARLVNDAGVDVVLVGDSVGNVKLGYANTLPVTVEEMLHHTRAVRRGNGRALLVADMPFLSYEFDPKDAVRQVGRLVKEGGAEAVKVEGAGPVLPSLKALIAANIPVMGHLGLTPQSIHRLGGHRVQGRDRAAAARLLRDAKTLERAGVFALVLEAVPAALARRVTRALRVPTIGIGAGPDTDGQILVLYDVLDITPGRKPRFVKNCMAGHDSPLAAVRSYVEAVKSRAYPAPEHCF